MLLALLILLFILSVPVLVGYFFYKWIKTKKCKWLVWFILLTTILIFLSYEIYTAIYPTDSFYFDEFKKVTSLDIPKSAEVIDKTVSYPDFHGDYTSCSIIKLSKADYTMLLDTLDHNKSMLKNPEIVGSKELGEVMIARKASDIKRSFSRDIPDKDYDTYIGFFKDGEHILVYFVNP
ncbi:hypothetical protein [Mucilaginibacter terrigena]|nr:hypothetical protein [Mucilaginibacter terrigena]